MTRREELIDLLLEKRLELTCWNDTYRIRKVDELIWLLSSDLSDQEITPHLNAIRRNLRWYRRCKTAVRWTVAALLFYLFCVYPTLC